MSQLQSQIFGLMLGLATAIGCLVYERLVREFSYSFMLIIFQVEVFLLWFAGKALFASDLKADFAKFAFEKRFWFWAVIYIATGITSLLWYKITRSQSVMVGSIYEVKYIVILALIYILFGESKFTLNTAIGVVFAICSIWFISKR